MSCDATCDPATHTHDPATRHDRHRHRHRYRHTETDADVDANTDTDTNTDTTEASTKVETETRQRHTDVDVNTPTYIPPHTSRHTDRLARTDARTHAHQVSKTWTRPYNDKKQGYTPRDLAHTERKSGTRREGEGQVRDLFQTLHQ